MTTLQEAARKSFEAWKKTGSCFYLSRNNAPGSDLDGYQDAYTQGQWVAWQAALAQQGERKNCPQPEICGSKECEFCRDTAAPAQQPVAYITDTEQGPMVWTPEMYDEACTYCDDGEFPVPLYTAAPQAQEHNADPSCTTVELAEMILSDCGCSSNNTLLVSRVANRIDAHMQSAQPVAQPLTDEQIMAIGREMGLKCKLGGNPNIDFDYARAIEAAHGIREVK